MMSFEECQEWGRKRREEEQALRERQKQIHEEELRKMGIDPNSLKTPRPQYEHPATPEKGIVVLLFIAGYVLSFLFKPWWLGVTVMTILLCKYVTRHDND